MSLIVTTDPHFTSNPDHWYRWSLFDFLRLRARKMIREGRSVDKPNLIICGDMTEAKSGHSAELVNRLTQEIARATDDFETIFLMKGNHDSLPGGESFFKFLQFVPDVRWADNFYFAGEGETRFLLVPFGSDYTKVRKKVRMEKCKFVFMHDTVMGARAANEHALGGVVLPKMLDISGVRVYSGDIHTRQKCGPVEYIGTPYPVDFDESHACRVLEISDSGKVTSVPTNIIRKHTLTVKSSRDLQKQLRGTTSGDQVKVRWVMAASDLARSSALFKIITNLCTDAGVVCTGGVEFIFDKGAGAHSIQFESGDTDAQRTAHDIFTEFVKLKRLRRPLINSGRKIMRGRLRNTGDPYSPKGECF
jgi:hypothetical protein